MTYSYSRNERHEDTVTLAHSKSFQDQWKTAIVGKLIRFCEFVIRLRQMWYFIFFVHLLNKIGYMLLSVCHCMTVDFLTICDSLPNMFSLFWPLLFCFVCFFWEKTNEFFVLCTLNGFVANIRHLLLIFIFFGIFNKSFLHLLICFIERVYSSLSFVF